MFLLSELFRLLRGQSGMGMGDVKLAVSIGLVVGYLGGMELVVFAYGSIIAAVVVAFALILTGRAKLASRIPFGPVPRGRGHAAHPRRSRDDELRARVPRSVALHGGRSAEEQACPSQVLRGPCRTLGGRSTEVRVNDAAGGARVNDRAPGGDRFDTTGAS
jgi:hypothetical protein